MTRFGISKNNYSYLRSNLRKVKGALALIRSLSGFFRGQITVEQAEKEIKTGLATREERFLEVMRANVYECPASPYLKLLQHAGCDYADLRTYVRLYGLEKALEQLAREGV